MKKTVTKWRECSAEEQEMLLAIICEKKINLRHIFGIMITFIMGIRFIADAVKDKEHILTYLLFSVAVSMIAWLPSVFHAIHKSRFVSQIEKGQCECVEVICRDKRRGHNNRGNYTIYTCVTEFNESYTGRLDRRYGASIKIEDTFYFVKTPSDPLIAVREPVLKNNC